jgi:23S rRNA pseudouridine1911/1915/1917 synthase
VPKVHWSVDAASAGQRLDKFLAAESRLGSRQRATSSLDRGRVYVNGAEVGIRDAGTKVSAGDVVSFWPDRPGSAARPHRPAPSGDLPIVYEDDVLIVINKPPGLLTVPLERKGSVPSVYNLIVSRFRSHRGRKPFVVHRIDQDSSGLVVFAKDPETQRALQQQFKRREPDRIYQAVVHGRVEPAEGTWRNYLVWNEKALIQKETHAGDRRGIESISDYRVVELFERASLLEVRLRTGRRNQIRVQAQLRGHPLIGERRYTDHDGTETIHFRRQALHAIRLSFKHPIDGRTLTFEGPPPADFVDLLNRLRRQRPRSMHHVRGS